MPVHCVTDADDVAFLIHSSNLIVDRPSKARENFDRDFVVTNNLVESLDDILVGRLESLAILRSRVQRYHKLVLGPHHAEVSNC